MEFHAVSTQSSAFVNKFIGGERDLEDLNGDSYLFPCMDTGVSRRLKCGRAAKANDRVLVVVYTYRGDTIRIISARKATALECKYYQEI